MGLLASGPSPGLQMTGIQVYYNAACGDCEVYLEEVLLPSLAEAGYTTVQLRDYLNVRAHREELNALNDAFEVPYPLRAHLATYVFDGGVLALQGHVPRDLVRTALDRQQAAEGFLLVYQDSMDEPTTYRIWAPPREPREYDVATPLDAYFRGEAGSPVGEGGFLLLVLASGLLDGLNPCAIAILLFFLAFLHVARRDRSDVLRMGVLYVAAIYLVYFLIGLGLLVALVLTGEAHLLARVAAFLVIALGLLTLGGLLWEPLGRVTRAPHRLWERAQPLLRQATLPSAFGAGLLVGLCTFPCSGGIYVAILGLLSTRTGYLTGLAYLYLYNLMFVLPLVAILAAVQNRSLARRLAAWEVAHRRWTRFLSGLLMVAVGALILLFFV